MMMLPFSMIALGSFRRSWPATASSRLGRPGRITVLSCGVIVSSAFASGSGRGLGAFMKEVLSHGVGQETAETADGVHRSLVDLKQAFRASQLQHHSGLLGKRSQLQITIAFMGFGHAAQQHFDAGCVQLNHLREIENQLRTVGAQKRLDVTEKLAGRAGIYPLRYPLHHHRSATGLHNVSLLPASEKTLLMLSCRRRKCQAPPQAPAMRPPGPACAPGPLLLVHARLFQEVLPQR